MDAPVFITHPPCSIVTEDIVELLLKTLVIIPSFVLISELSGPLALSPRVTESNELQTINFTNVEDTICVVEQDASLSCTLSLLSVIVLHDVGAPY